MLVDSIIQALGGFQVPHHIIKVTLGHHYLALRSLSPYFIQFHQVVRYDMQFATLAQRRNREQDKNCQHSPLGNGL